MDGFVKVGWCAVWYDTGRKAGRVVYGAERIGTLWRGQVG